MSIPLLHDFVETKGSNSGKQEGMDNGSRRDDPNPNGENEHVGVETALMSIRLSKSLFLTLTRFDVVMVKSCESFYHFESEYVVLIVFFFQMKTLLGFYEVELMAELKCLQQFQRRI